MAATQKRVVSKLLLASFIGLAVALSPAILAGHFKLLPLYDSLNTVQAWATTTMVKLINLAYRQLRDFWLRFKLSDCVVKWDAATPAEYIFTDANEYALGAHLRQVHLDQIVS